MFPLFANGVIEPAANMLPAVLTPRNIAANIDTTSRIGGKFAPGVIHTSGKVATGVVDTGDAPWLANIFANFWKNFEMTLML